MSIKDPTPRRVHVERNIYSRRDADGRLVYEVGYRDSTGRQRWQHVDGGITAARTVRNDILARKGKGERVQPNPRLKFGEAADAWLAKQVSDLRPATRATYTNAVDTHLRPRWGRRRLDQITVDDAAVLVRELRAAGKSEWTIAGVLTAARRVFTFAKRRMNWFGTNPVTELDKGERAAVSATARRPLFTADQLAATLAASEQPYRTMFAVAAITGARLSEVLGLVWADLGIANVESAEIRFEQQVDRSGQRQPLKTEEARRTVEIPRQLALMLVAQKLVTIDTSPTSFVFATRTGRAIDQRSVGHALRRAQVNAVDVKGRPAFPVLHQVDPEGKTIDVDPGIVPSFHSFRHTAASEAIAAGESVEEMSWQLGHKNSNITRAVYIQQVKTAERTARRRQRMEHQYGQLLATAAETTETAPHIEEVIALSKP